MPLILLTNDDGIHAPGLAALESAVAGLGEVWTIAPDIERSACARAVTLDRPLRLRELGPRRLAVDGTPADCVLLAFRCLLAEPPALVLSGINHGLNIGEDVDYSGTVAAAAEGCLQGARAAAAFSVGSECDAAAIDRAAGFARTLAAELLERRLPAGTFLNVNLPPGPSSRVRLTRLGDPLPPGSVAVGTDPRGKPYYWIANRPDQAAAGPDTDRGALREGCISLCLLELDRTHRGAWSAPDLQAGGFVVEDPA